MRKIIAGIVYRVFSNEIAAVNVVAQDGKLFLPPADLPASSAYLKGRHITVAAMGLAPTIGTVYELDPKPFLLISVLIPDKL